MRDDCCPCLFVEALNKPFATLLGSFKAHFGSPRGLGFCNLLSYFHFKWVMKLMC